jgi:DNA-binding protein H-NS
MDGWIPPRKPGGGETSQAMTDPKDLDLSKLSLAELRQLSDRVENEISERREAGKRWLRQYGLVERRGPLYRNPSNAAETWSGKGKQPAWVEHALAEGYTLESLATETDQDLPTHSRRGAD